MTVVDAFELEDRTVLVPGVDGHRARAIGECTIVDLRRPDGSVLTARVVGVELPAPNEHRRYPLALAPEFTREHIPAGTEVWTSGIGP